ncbi:unnamed protein product [Cylindrotheca closterium]|uniref:Uncharacterized protein n=1 Tax=Cylindrotheca closterium TaxID=2856 RepID=A0AAD2FN91_9STRA|nr:unnamed protein product [Cylindrotheca closterium]
MKGFLSVAFTASVKVAVARQLDQAIVFTHVSEAIKCPIRIPGLLFLVTTKNFGAVSTPGFSGQSSATMIRQRRQKLLLSLKSLLSKTLQPLFSPMIGATTHPLSNNLADGDITALRTPKPMRPRSTISRASGLFTHIVPSKEPGIWIFIVWKKFA